MENSSARVIKGRDVKLEGTIRLDTGMPQQAQARERNASAASASVQARIIETQPQYAVIEVICSCGTKTHIRCEFADAAKGQ